MDEYMIRRILLPIFLALGSLYAVQVPTSANIPPHPTVQRPWFTGPLLAPSGVTIPKGHYNIEPYVYSIATYGRYTSDWQTEKVQTFLSNYTQPSLQFGLTPWLDFEFDPTAYYNYTRGAGKWALGDMPISIDIQILNTSRSLTSWNTALKLALRAVIPLGKYQKLDADKLLTDVGGQGSWQPAIALVWGNIFYIGGNRFITWRNAVEYTLPNPVRVRGLNAYGGGEGTSGTVYPSQSFNIDTAIEITLTRNWVFAMDVVGNWTGKTRFKGVTTASNTSPASVQFSLAPAIEYNWSANIGLIAGPWFTIAGRNASQFAGGIIAFNYYH